MAVTAYGDESYRRPTYVLAAAVVPDGQRADARKTLQQLRTRGASRIHMSREADRHRRRVIDAVTSMSLVVHVVHSERGQGSTLRGCRDECLRSVADILMLTGVDRLILESCGQDPADRQVLAAAVRRPSAAEPGSLSYGHVQPQAEPLVWLPDIVAWAWGAGPTWRERIQPIVAPTIRRAG